MAASPIRERLRMRLVIGIVVISSCLLQAACSLPNFRLPRVHKVTVQQGNVITQRMIDQLEPGLTRSQVAYIMGEPIYRNTFDDSRWDYLYSIEIPGAYREQKRLTVYFENDVMTHFDGDYSPTTIAQPDANGETPVPESGRGG